MTKEEKAKAVQKSEDLSKCMDNAALAPDPTAAYTACASGLLPVMSGETTSDGATGDGATDPQKDEDFNRCIDNAAQATDTEAAYNDCTNAYAPDLTAQTGR